MGDYITIQANDGGSFNAYRSVPPSTAAAGVAKLPAIILLQEIFGINDYIKSIADRLAGQGYVVLAPDLFWRLQPNITLGYSPEEWQIAYDLFSRFDTEAALADIAATIRGSRQLACVNGRVGTVGFCLGGRLAYLTACRCDIDIAVGFYGVGIEKYLSEAGNIKAKLTLHFAENDGLCQEKERSEIFNALQDKANIELYLYSEVDHAFARDMSENFNKAAADLAMTRTMTALKQALA